MISAEGTEGLSVRATNVAAFHGRNDGDVELSTQGNDVDWRSQKYVPDASLDTAQAISSMKLSGAGFLQNDEASINFPEDNLDLEMGPTEHSAHGIRHGEGGGLSTQVKMNAATPSFPPVIRQSQIVTWLLRLLISLYKLPQGRRRERTKKAPCPSQFLGTSSGLADIVAYP